jgi:hypothetical protein
VDEVHQFDILGEIGDVNGLDDCGSHQSIGAVNADDVDTVDVAGVVNDVNGSVFDPGKDQSVDVTGILDDINGSVGERENQSVGTDADTDAATDANPIDTVDGMVGEIVSGRVDDIVTGYALMTVVGALACVEMLLVKNGLIVGLESTIASAHGRHRSAFK